MLALKIIGFLLLFFGYIICMAIGGGLLHAMWLETDEAKEGKIFHSGRAWGVVKQYKLRNPEGRKHIQARNASLLGTGLFFAMIAYLWIMAS